MKFVKLVIILFGTIILSGCYNYRELNDMAIVQAVSIDYKDKKYEVGIQVLNAKKSAANGGTGADQKIDVTVYHATGKNVKEGLSNISKCIPKSIYLSHMKVLILSEKVAKKGLYDIFDYFMREVESRKEFLTVIAKNKKALDYIKIITPIDNVSALSLEENADLIQQGEGYIYFMSFDELYSKTKSKYIDPVLPSVNIKDGTKKGGTDANISSTEPKAKIIFTGNAIIKNHKLAGYLSTVESFGFNILNGTLKNGTINFKCDDKNNYASIKLIDVKSNVDIDVKKSEIIVNLKAKAPVVSFNCKLNLTKPKNMAKVELMAKNKIKNIVKKTIKKANIELNTKALGFVDNIYKNNNKFYRKNKNNLEELISKYKLKYKISLDIKRKGSIINAIKEEKS